MSGRLPEDDMAGNTEAYDGVRDSALPFHCTRAVPGHRTVRCSSTRPSPLGTRYGPGRRVGRGVYCSFEMSVIEMQWRRTERLRRDE